MTYFDQVSQAATFLQTRLTPLTPKIGIVLGSGLGAVADAVTNSIVVPYAEIPHFPQSTVVGHSGRIVAGSLGGTPVMVMQGRVHYYEGYTPQQVTFPMRVLGALGLRAVVLTNAAGGIAEGYRIGQLVALADHINLMGFNPLAGPNEPRFAVEPGAGLRFFDMTEAYSKALRSLAAAAAHQEGFSLAEGVYLAVSGPSFETPAEIRAFRALGATLVGMSTVPETIVARHMGIQVLGISCVTNLAAGLGATPLSHEEVFEAGRQVEHRLANLLHAARPAHRCPSGAADVSVPAPGPASLPESAARSLPPVVLAIAGCSGSGKTTLAAELARALGGVHFHFDNYYLDLSHMPIAERALQNFDDPALIESPLLIQHVAALAQGRAIQRPLYDFATYTRIPGRTETFLPGPFVLVEGLFALHYKNLLPLYQLRIYIDTPDELCFERRLKRDMEQRGRTPESVRRQYDQPSAPPAWPTCAHPPFTPTSPSTAVVR